MCNQSSYMIVLLKSPFYYIHSANYFDLIKMICKKYIQNNKVEEYAVLQAGKSGRTIHRVIPLKYTVCCNFHRLRYRYRFSTCVPCLTHTRYQYMCGSVGSRNQISDSESRNSLSFGDRDRV